MSFEIDCPSGVNPTNVVLATGGTTGVVCGHGDAEDDDGTVATLIQALVVQNFDPAGPSLQTPPAGALTVQIDDGQWISDQIPGAVCGPMNATLANTLIVWYTVPTLTGTTIVRQTVAFMGVCATTTDCCGFGSGSGNGSGSMSPMEAAPQSVPMATAPLLWAILASGFEAGKALFNGPWALNLRPTPSGACVWDNGGDGADSPLVELRCESPIATTWRLTFRHGTDAVVQYTRPATEWNPLGANIVTKVGNGVAHGTVPSHLTVTPG